MVATQTFQIADRSFVLETGVVARQAHGSVLLRTGRSAVLAAVVVGEASTNAPDFVPLTVEYREKMAAIGRIPGGGQRREGRIFDHEVLAARLIDRAVRPLFPSGFRAETQLHVTILSADPDEFDPLLLGVLAAGAALHLSPVPWAGPMAALRIARIDGNPRCHPSHEALGQAECDLVVAATPSGLVMLDGGGREVPESVLIETVERAMVELQPAFEALDQLRLAAGKPKAAFEDPGTRGDTGAARRAAREKILTEGRRADGRGPSDLREIAIQARWLPVPHGSVLFTRGETQAAVSCTLGPQSTEMVQDTLSGPIRSRFFLHYNFPPYAVGEVRQSRGPVRREIGHGALAERALRAVLPRWSEFPYVVRLESDITGSDGSSSMATVCGGSLALMDAGVPLRAAVAGIAMGLVAGSERTVVLSDILGSEDEIGDMDFKIAGTARGITSFQLDNKIGVIAVAVAREALEGARAGLAVLLAKMAEALPAPRPELATGVPRQFTIRIPKAAVGILIGPRGATVKAIQAESGAELTVSDDGVVSVSARDGVAAAMVRARVEDLAGVVQVGKTYQGRVMDVLDFGAVVRVFESAEGLVHISEWDHARTESMAAVAKKGDALDVVVLGVDQRGKIRLSRKATLSPPAEVAPQSIA